MAGRTPSEAFQRYIEPLREALTCVTQYRFTPQVRHRLRADEELAVALEGTRPVPLSGEYKLSTRIAQRVRITRDDEDSRVHRHFEIIVVEYWYGFIAPNGKEVLTFHWTPEALDPAAIRFPHVHIGPTITAG